MAKKKTRSDVSRSRKVAGVQLDFVPENEQGVVFLFSQLAKRFGVRVKKIQREFPDCIAEDCDRNEIRIEFEYKSRNFKTHKHSAKKCDWIVCWQHNWPQCPKNLKVIELRKHFGLGFNVWLVPIGGDFREEVSEIGQWTNDFWSAPSGGAKGDLILVYRTRPDKFIKDLFILRQPVEYVEKDYEEGEDYMAPLSRVAVLDTPIHLKELKSHPILKTTGFVRGDMRDRYRLSVHWPELFEMIIERNPKTRKALSKYGPEKLWEG